MLEMLSTIPKPMQGIPPQQIIEGHISQGAVNTPFTEPVVMTGPPSEAAKVIGILIMVYGGIAILGGIVNAFAGPLLGAWAGSLDPTAAQYMTPNWVYYAQGFLGLVSGVAYLYSGWLTQNFERRGIHFTWIILGITMIFGTILVAVIPYPDVEGMDSGTMKIISAGSAALGGICGAGVCGLLAAIPLFISNNGMK